VKLPDVQARLAGLGGEIGSLTTEQFAAFARTDYERAGKLIRDAKVKID
jgi:tripartite-type tricarboxylate transporter receptor subunit TctC